MKKINLTKLVITVFAISWIGVLPSILLAYGYSIPKFLTYFHILMTLGPMLGAIAFVYFSGKKKGLITLFKRLFIIKIKPYVFLIAILTPILIIFLAAKLGLSLSDSLWPSSYNFSTIFTTGFIIFLGYLIGNTEEIVWRGVVFDNLLEKYGFYKSCFILTPIWWLFHIPLFLYPEGHPAGYSILEFTAFIIPMNFILGWIYINSKKSLLYVHLHHQLFNGFGQAFPVFPIFIAGNLFPVRIMGFLLFVLAILLLLIKPSKSKSPFGPVAEKSI